MLKLICGRAASGKTTEILNCIKDCATVGEDIVYIVPEQFSFESERAVLSLLGDGFASKVNVLSFSSLADTLMTICGGTAISLLSDSDKIMFMSKALTQLKDSLPFWKKFLSTTDFATKVVDMIGEFKVAAIFPEDIEKVADNLSGSLQKKIKALALVYRTYDALLGHKFIDPADKLQKLYENLFKHKYFENKTVFVDGFKGFTGQQYRIFDCIFAQAKSVTVALTLGENDKTGIFENTEKTAAKLTQIAQKYHKEVKREYLNDTYYTSIGIKSVEEILSQGTDDNQKDGKGVTLCVAKGCEDEVKFTARNIRRLVREEGYRYKDFVVIARDVQTYEAAIEREFAINDISCFFDKRVAVNISPVYTVIESAINCTGAFSSEEIFRYLKTGLVLDFTQQEISELENYVYLWGIDGDGWKKQWDMDPTGFSETDKKREQEISDTLNRLNELRIKVIEPLSELSNFLKGNMLEMAKAIVLFLEKIKCSENMKRMLFESANDFSPEDIDVLRQSWECIMNVLDGLVKCFGEDKLTSYQFKEMFTTACSLTTVGRIPQMLDEVTFGEAERIRPSRPKVAFILGANYGVFPAAAENNSIISNKERKLLEKNGLALKDKTVFQTVEENLLVYSCLCCPSERLYITCSEAGESGKSKEPSGFFVNLKEHLDGAVLTSEPSYDFGEESYPETRESAFRMLCDATGNNSEYVGSLAKAVLDSKESRERFSGMVSACGKYDMHLSKEKAKKLFGNNIHISATKFDTYHTCRFSYFCKYGLKTDIIQPAKLDTLQRGTIVHYVLERFFNNHLSDIESVNDTQIIAETDEYMGDYFAGIKGSEFLFTARFNFLISKIKEGIVDVLRRIVAEFSQSKFRPQKCEVKIGRDSTIPTVEFPFSEDGKLSLTGSIDRLDSWGSYIRIVDYKTGSKKFALSDTLYGQNLQMLIYLYCVIRGNNPDYKGKIPAGILYLISKKDINKSGMSMNGLLTDNIDVVEAMEKENKGEFIPQYKLTAKKELDKRVTSYIPQEAFDTIFDYIEELAKKMGETLHSGDIAVDPIDGCDRDACKYCNYSGVCGIEDEEHRAVEKLSNSEIIENMRGGEESGL